MTNAPPLWAGQESATFLLRLSGGDVSENESLETPRRYPTFADLFNLLPLWKIIG